jgi:hypothetical protein
VDSWGIKTLPSLRKTTFDLPNTASETVDITLTVPGNLVLLIPESRSEITNAAGNYLLEISQDAGKIVIHKELHINSNKISPSEYLAFKTLMDNWNLPSSREIVFVGK